MTRVERTDVAIVGSGVGGATLAYGLRDSGADILVLERGDFLHRERENWSVEEVFTNGRYQAPERWEDHEGRPFNPRMHYHVGGNTKVYGGALWRFREADFSETRHEDGVSPAWPISYDDLEPYYARAEEVYRVHGDDADDVTAPRRSGPHPFPAVPHEPAVVELARRLRDQGLRPISLPLGLDRRTGDGACVLCATCDGFPCLVSAKSDAETACLRPALERPNVRLWPCALVRRLLTSTDGERIIAVEVERDGELIRVEAETFVVASGAVNSAALLLRSANAAHPNGIANSSGLVGRNYMIHNNTVMMAAGPQRNPTVFQKTLALNDFYWGTDEWPYPLGNVQMVGKIQRAMMGAEGRRVPGPILRGLTRRSLDFRVLSEDLPDPDNRVTVLPGGRLRVEWRPNNRETHAQLVRKLAAVLRRAGYPLVVSRFFAHERPAHQCGTLRFGREPGESVLDPMCRAHDVENLYVVDASHFPSSSALNPVLTIAAQALRVADLAGIGDAGSPREAPAASRGPALVGS